MKHLILLLLPILCFVIAHAQHDHSQHQHSAPVKKAPTNKVATKDSVDTPRTEHIHGAEPEAHDHSSHAHNEEMVHEGHDKMSMSHAFSLNLPMNRNGSGTSWLPDESPMYGYMLHAKKWMFMFHGNVFIRYNNQDFTGEGIRGDSKFDVPSWLMAMGQRKIGNKGLFHFSLMMSGDPFTIGGKGYPLLFQTGETWQGKPLVDRQHPHDLFSELSVSYAQAISKDVDIVGYFGYPGEPALGTVAFMHRPSALYNPDAPLSHHWVDATHITFGVATLGVRLKKFKLEGSLFTGREPDENRYNFDKPRFDSRSARVSYNPTRNWAMQVSHGSIKSPEELHGDENVYRTTASIIYTMRLGTDKGLNAAAVWGLNKTPGHDGEHAALMEAALTLNRFATYMRYEFSQKSAEELVLEEPQFNHQDVFNVNAITLGAAYDILRLCFLRVAGGAQFSLYHSVDALNGIYGDNPMAGEVYLRIYPPRM